MEYVFILGLCMFMLCVWKIYRIVRVIKIKFKMIYDKKSQANQQDNLS
jgi:sensor histidine kinase YesM